MTKDERCLPVTLPEYVITSQENLLVRRCIRVFTIFLQNLQMFCFTQAGVCSVRKSVSIGSPYFFFYSLRSFIFRTFPVIIAPEVLCPSNSLLLKLILKELVGGHNQRIRPHEGGDTTVPT